MRAPGFRLPAHTGELFDLEERLARSPVLLVFYPFAFSSVCGSELHELAERHDAFSRAGIAVAGVSVDSKFALAAYAQAEGLPFELLSDFWPHGATSRAFDAFDERQGMATRLAVLVDPDGTIVQSVSSPLGEGRDFSAFLPPH